MLNAVSYFRVLPVPKDLPDPHEYGFEQEADFREELSKTAMLYAGRIGEFASKRHAFFLLRFYDTPDGWPEDGWIPRFMLERAAPPRCKSGFESNEMKEIENAFGF